jgi:hypothetical protein
MCEAVTPRACETPWGGVYQNKVGRVGADWIQAAHNRV